MRHPAASATEGCIALSLSLPLCRSSHSGSRCGSQDLPRRTTSRGRATEASSLSVGRHSGSRCDSQDLPQRTTSRGHAALSFLFLGRNPNKLLSGCKLKEEPRDEAQLGLPEYHVREMTPPQERERLDDPASEDTTQLKHGVKMCYIPPKYRDMTDEESHNPAIFIVLSTLGRVLALRNSPIPIPQQGPPALPNTSIVRNWVTTEVVQQTKAPPQDLQPTVTANPALSPRVLLFHQLKQVEFSGLMSTLGLRSQWGAELLQQGISAGQFFVVIRSAIHQIPVTPFIAL